MSTSDVDRRHPEDHRAGIGSKVDNLQNSSVDRKALERLTDEGWHTMAAIPEYQSAPSGPSGPRAQDSDSQLDMPAQQQASDAATVGSDSRETVIHQSSNQSQRKSEDHAESVSGSKPKQDNVHGEEASVDRRRTYYNNHPHSRGRARVASTAYANRRGGQQHDNRGPRLSRRYRGINFSKGKPTEDHLLTSSNNPNYNNNHYYNNSNDQSHFKVIKTTTTSTGTVPPHLAPTPEATAEPEPHSHPSELEPTSSRPGERTEAEEGKQNHGDRGSRVSKISPEVSRHLILQTMARNGGQPPTSIQADDGKQTIPQTVDTLARSTQESAIAPLDRVRSDQTPDQEVVSINKNDNNDDMAYGSRYPSGTQPKGAAAFLPPPRDGALPFTTRRSSEQPRTWERGYVPQQGRASYNNWVPPHLKKEKIMSKEPPAEGKTPTLFTFENSGQPSREPELTETLSSNQTGYSDAGNASKKPPQHHTPETASGAFGGEGSRPVEGDAKANRTNGANIENIHGPDKQGLNASANEPNGGPKSAAPTKILAHRGPKPNQSNPKDVPKVNNKSRVARWGTKAESKPSKISPQDHGEEVSGEGNGSWPSNETVRSVDGLRNWNGGWAPPPIEWETRPGWKDRNMTEHLNVWLESSLANEAPDLKSPDFHSGVGTVDGKSLVAPPEEEETLPNPEKSEKAGQTSNTAMLMKRIRWLERRLHEKDKQLAQALANTGPIIYAPDIPENPHAPRANIYLRHAVLADLAACKDIYNHYAAVSVIVPERDPISEERVREHYEDVRSRLHLPWLVAVERKPESNGYASAGKDKIVGYAFADDYSGPKDTYRYTVEIQVFTHHEHLRMGIGKTLMDRLMIFLDPMYLPRGGYDFIDNDDFWGPGGQRVISKVLCNIPYTVEDNSEMKWLKKWLENFEFDEMGTLKEVGLKFNKW